MLPVQFIREEKERVLRSLKIRGFKEFGILDEIIAKDDRRKAIQKESDDKRAEAKGLQTQIGPLMKSGKKEEAAPILAITAQIKLDLAAMDEEAKEVEEALYQLLLQVPNACYHLVPEGFTPEDNEVYKAWEEPMPDLGENPLPHWELAQKYKLIDFELGVKITGAGFPVYINRGARLQRALINFFLDEAVKAGYVEHQVPHLVNEASALGTGQLPDKEGQMYHVTVDDLYMIPTAEVPLTNIYRDVVLEEADFPIQLCGYTPCFRREAGSYGAHVRGLNRLHQFDKVEIVRLEHPERSYDALMGMLEHVEGLLDKLGLPYRILRLCGGDIGFASAMTFDFETYSAAQERWLEVSSVSNFETFQSNRLKLRYRPTEGKDTILAHTLNGSALALPRILATLLENNQTPEGIVIPECLRPYTGFDIIQ